MRSLLKIINILRKVSKNLNKLTLFSLMKTKILTDLVSEIGEKESLGETDACQQEFHDPQDYRPVHPHDGVPVDDRPLLEFLFCQIP